LSRVKAATNFDEGGPAVFARLVASVDDAVAQAKIEFSQVAGIGLAIPGQIVPQSTIVRYAPNLGWRDFDLTPLFPEHWKCPVVVDNDVRMGTYGEWTRGAAQGSKHVFGVFAGTGVGGGLILNGELFHGFNGHAGEIGHTIIHWKRGIELEAIAGRRNLMNRARDVIADHDKLVRKQWKGVDPASFKSSQIAEWHDRGDPVMIQLVDECARAIGAGVGSVLNLLGPEVIVVGGGMTKALGQDFVDRIWEFATRYALPRATENVRCVMAALLDDAGVTGAAAYVKSRVGSTPAKPAKARKAGGAAPS
jgi:glucokinase